MATFTKVYCFVEDLGLKKHNLDTDTLKVYLTNGTPTTGTTVYNTPTDLSTSGGYTAGGADATGVWTQSTGTAQLAGTDVVFTATSGFGPFRYAILYNDTAAAKNVIGFWDYGSALTLAASETFTVDFGSTVLTLA